MILALAALVVALCIILFALAFVAPRLSARPQQAVDSGLTKGEFKARRAPGGLGRWLPKPFAKSREAADASASAGRRGRWKLPF